MKRMTKFKIALAACGIACVSFALIAGPVMTATEDFVNNETKKVETKLTGKINTATATLNASILSASNNVTKIAKAEDYIVKTNLLSKINRIADKDLGVTWEALMVNGQLYYVATMPYEESAENTTENTTPESTEE